MFIKQKCPCCTNSNIGLFQKWKKFHFENNLSSCKHCNERWKINSKYKSASRWCFICYGFLLLFPYIILNNYIFGLISNNTQNLIYVILNLGILLIPAVLMEVLIILLLPLECEN